VSLLQSNVLYGLLGANATSGCIRAASVPPEITTRIHTSLSVEIPRASVPVRNLGGVLTLDQAAVDALVSSILSIRDTIILFVWWDVPQDRVDAITADGYTVIQFAVE